MNNDIRMYQNSLKIVLKVRELYYGISRGKLTESPLKTIHDKEMNMYANR
jgi:hypothetical protein